MLAGEMQQAEGDMGQVCGRGGAGGWDATGPGRLAAGSLPQVVLASGMRQAEGAMLQACHAGHSFAQASQAVHGFLQGLPGILRSKLGSPRRAVCMLCIVAAILQQLVPALIVLLG